uniref:Choice-of-anchor I domain-containing protein n=1 Tax=Branchiostoma floridae TaxID=7739 RepID=C3YI73_BRAFL|eukprot:XP_002604199.1 hypothetical protein BRAFLDRAFT_73459 [Branchiostoma floridae]
MAFAVLMMMAAAVLPNFARSAITLIPMGSTYLPYGFDPAGAPLYGMGDRGAVEQLTYDADNYRIYTVGEARILNVIDISDPKNAALVYQLQLPGGATDVDSCGRFVAVSIHDDFKVLPGTVLIYSMYDTTRKNMTLLHQIQVGALPDMVKFTKDCMTLVTCNEGEPGLDESGNFVDPEGSASVIAFQSTNLGQESAPTVRTATFRKFDSLAEEYNSRGVRWTLPMIQVGSEVMEFNLSQTLEPEYVAYNSDGSKAYIALQENNAIAVLDMATATFDDIYPLGSKYWGTASIDTSNEDGGSLVSRNLKSQRVQKAMNLTSQLGCAVFSSIDGLDPENPDKYSSLHLFGGRGFSVWDADDLSLVWDSGDDVERMVAKYYPTIFNSDYDEEFFNSTPAARFDHRSCKKGPETESLAIGEVDGKTAFFVGNERSSTILVYSLADEDIITPVFQSIHFSGRTDLTWRQAYQDRVVGDIDPEDMRFVSTRDSPTNSPLLLVAGTVSGTVSVYEVAESDDDGVSTAGKMKRAWLQHLVAKKLGADAVSIGRSGGETSTFSPPVTRYRQFGKISKETIGNKTFVSVYDPRDIETLFRTEGPNPSWMQLMALGEVRKRLGKPLGMINETGQKWRQLRYAAQSKLLNPKSVSSFVPVLDEISRDFVEKLRTGRSAATLEPTIDLDAELRKWSLESVVSATLGIRLGCLQKHRQIPDKDTEDLLQSSDAFLDTWSKLELGPPLYMLYPTKTWRKFLRANELWLRVLPAFSMRNRILDKEIVLSGYRVPPNVIIRVLTHVTGQLPEYVVEPDRFAPERWLRDDTTIPKPHPFAVRPFGVGTRSCIGQRLAEQELGILLAKMIQQFHIECDGEMEQIFNIANKPDLSGTFKFTEL